LKPAVPRLQLTPQVAFSAYDQPNFYQFIRHFTLLAMVMRRIEPSKRLDKSQADGYGALTMAPRYIFAEWSLSETDA
jgi:hypothetical protein